MEFMVLYTHQKTKKSKKWQDGKLRVSNNGKVVLLNDSDNQVETIYVKADQIKVGEEIESDRHLITVEEEVKSMCGNDQVVNNQERNRWSGIKEEHQKPHMSMMRDPSRRKRMGFTVPRQLSQQPSSSSSDLSKENIQLNTQRVGYKSQHADFGCSMPQAVTTYPTNIFSPLHKHDNLQMPPSCFNFRGKTNRDERTARNLAGMDRLEESKCFSSRNDDQRVPGFIDQRQQPAPIKRIHVNDSSMQSTEGNKQSDNQESNRSTSKRSASQILALLGKKKQTFQPPLKKTKFDTDGNEDSSSCNADVGESFIPECKRASIQGERLVGAVKDLPKNVQTGRGQPLERTMQGMLALHTAEITAEGNVERDKYSNELTEEKIEFYIDGKWNKCLEYNNHTTLSETSLITQSYRYDLGEGVMDFQQSIQKGVNIYGVACIHRTRTGEDCGSVEAKISSNRGRNAGTKQTLDVISCDIQSGGVAGVAVMEAKEESILEDEMIMGKDGDDAQNDGEDSGIIEGMTSANRGCHSCIKQTTDKDVISCDNQSFGVAGVTVMETNKSMRPEDEMIGAKDGDDAHNIGDTWTDDKDCGSVEGNITGDRSWHSDVKQSGDDDMIVSGENASVGAAGVSVMETKETSRPKDEMIVGKDGDGDAQNDGEDCGIVEGKISGDDDIVSSENHSVGAGVMAADIESKRTKDEDTGETEEADAEQNDGEVNLCGYDNKQSKNQSEDHLIDNSGEAVSVLENELCLGMGQLDCDIPEWLPESFQSGILFDGTEVDVASSVIHVTNETVEVSHKDWECGQTSDDDKSQTCKDSRESDVNEVKKIAVGSSPTFVSDGSQNTIITGQAAIQETTDCKLDSNWTSHSKTTNVVSKIDSGISGINEDARSECMKIDFQTASCGEVRDGPLSCSLVEKNGPTRNSVNTITGFTNREQGHADGSLMITEREVDSTVYHSDDHDHGDTFMKDERVYDDDVDDEFSPVEYAVREVMAKVDCNVPDVHRHAAVTTSTSEKENLLDDEDDRLSVHLDNIAVKYQNDQISSFELKGESRELTENRDGEGTTQGTILYGRREEAAVLINSIMDSKHVDMEQPQHIVDPRTETNKESTPSFDLMVGNHHMQENCTSSSELEETFTSTFHSGYQKAALDDVGKGMREDMEYVITSCTKNEMSCTDSSPTNGRKSKTRLDDVASLADLQSGRSCFRDRSQADCTVVDVSSDFTNSHSQNSLLSVTSVDTLDYSFPTSQPDLLITSKEDSISQRIEKKAADDSVSGSEVIRGGSSFSRYVRTSDITQKQRHEKNTTLYSDDGNHLAVCSKGDRFNNESSQEFLMNVSEIFEKIPNTEYTPDGHESKTVDAVVSPSPRFSGFIPGDEMIENDNPLHVSVSSSLTGSPGIRCEQSGYSEIQSGTNEPHLMTHLDHLERDDSSQEPLVKDPFSFPSLHASNILLHPSELQSSSTAKSRSDLIISPPSSQLIHTGTQRHSHYWRQPLASSLVRRRPPSPTVMCASSYRDELMNEEPRNLHQGIQALNSPAIPSMLNKFDDLAMDFKRCPLYNNSGQSSDIDEQHRLGFDGRNIPGDWRRPELNEPDNLRIQQPPYQSIDNVIINDFNEHHRLAFDGHNISGDWRGPELYEPDNLRIQQPPYQNIDNVTIDDFNEHHRLAFDGHSISGEWRRPELNEPENLFIQQPPYQNTENVIIDNFNELHRHDGCSISGDWRRQELNELENLLIQEPPYQNTENVIIDDLNGQHRFNFDGRNISADWKRPELNEPENVLIQQPLHQNTEYLINDDQQCMPLSHQHGIPSGDKLNANHSIADFLQWINKDCMTFKPVAFTPRNVDYPTSHADKEQMCLDVDGIYKHCAIESPEHITSSPSQIVDINQFSEARVPDWDSSVVRRSITTNAQIGRVTSEPHPASSTTPRHDEMSPIISDHHTSYHHQSEFAPLVSQQNLLSVTETSRQVYNPIDVFSQQPVSVECSPQCVPYVSPVISNNKCISAVGTEIEPLDDQTEILRWLEGDRSHSQKLRIVPGTPMVAAVDIFTEDHVGHHDEHTTEQTVPSFLTGSTIDVRTARPANVSTPAKKPHLSLKSQTVKNTSSSFVSYSQFQSQEESFSKAKEGTIQNKRPPDDEPSPSQVVFCKKLLRTPIIAMATEDYEASQLFVDCESTESRSEAHSFWNKSENGEKRSFRLPEPYPDGQSSNCRYSSLNQYEEDGDRTFSNPTKVQSFTQKESPFFEHQSSRLVPISQWESKHLSSRRVPISQWESSEPSEQDYRNHPDEMSNTQRSHLDRFSNEDEHTSHGELLRKEGRKIVNEVEITTPSLPSQTITGRFETPLLRDLRQVKVHGLDGRNICAELLFPSLKDVTAVSVPQREVKIPTTFPDAVSYKQVLTAVLKEHVNIVLYRVAYNFFSALSKVDVSGYSALSTNGACSEPNPPCQHKQPSKRICVKKDGANKGRFFFTCSKPRGSQCKFFQWADQGSRRSSNGQSSRPSKEVLSDSKSIEMYLKSFGVSLYCECQLVRKSSYTDHLGGAPAWIRKYRRNKLNNERKRLYLRISRRESSSVYGKDDIWIISEDLTFDSSNSFLAKSIFHGPNTASEVEIEPISGYSPSNWPSEVPVHALHAYNASTELSCLSNIQEFVNPRTLPVLPALLSRYNPSVSAKLHQTSFKSPALSSSSDRKLCCSNQQIMEVAEEVKQQYHLNQDQTKALLDVAGMFMDNDGNGQAPPICLIHGVFGAGKSYLLAITVLFLSQLFHLHEENGGSPNDWKVLISSTTNVAVDRILLNLLQLGFEEFIRVGSIRKIAKPVLPYSVHASDKESQEVKELQEMLRGDLSVKEKSFVRKSIERQRLGLNKKMLSKVLVVGVTCAACTFPCIRNLKFPVVLLDECSQITEPACLLPVARFECQKLVLVGDPNQLDPTIQGSEPAHKFSLEQTLFDRLLLMGYKPTMLKTQYRCHPRISAIANELFYNGKLLDGVNELQRKELAEDFPTLSFYNVADGKECRTTGGSYLNDKEATFLVTMLETLMISGVEPSQVGVITLYKAQVSHISTLLQQSRLVGLRDLKAIQISTVDAFQGGEKDIIILSCVRSDFMGFAASDKRTNVALTRSKHHLLIVGNQRILSANSLWSKVIFKCREHKDGMQDSSSLLKEWTARLDEAMLEERRKTKTKRAPKKKEVDLFTQPEYTNSPPISLDSQDDDDDEQVTIAEEGTSAAIYQSDGSSSSIYQLKPTDVEHPVNAIGYHLAQPQDLASDVTIIPSQISSNLTIDKCVISQSMDSATKITATDKSLTNLNFDGDSRNCTDKRILEVTDTDVSDSVEQRVDQCTIQSVDVNTETVGSQSLEAEENGRNKMEASLAPSCSSSSSRYDGQINVSVDNKELVSSSLREKSPSKEQCKETRWTREKESLSYSPLKDYVESSDDELPNFYFDTAFL